MAKAAPVSITKLIVPILPLRDVVVYPHMVIPLFVGRRKSIKALEAASQKDNLVVLVAQKNPGDDDPAADNLYSIGTLARILQLLKLPDGTFKLLVEGTQRAEMVKTFAEEDYLLAELNPLDTTPPSDAKELDVLVRSVLTQFDQYIKLNKKIPAEILASLNSIENPDKLADTIAAHIVLKIPDKQKILEAADLQKRLELLLGYMDSEIDLLQVEKRIRGRVKHQMEKSQREYYLNEQIKAIQKELGDLENGPNEMDALKERIDKAGMNEEAKTKAIAEYKKLICRGKKRLKLNLL
jgi:ATP-dependent Lon protease